MSKFNPDLWNGLDEEQVDWIIEQFIDSDPVDILEENQDMVADADKWEIEEHITYIKERQEKLRPNQTKHIAQKIAKMMIEQDLNISSINGIMGFAKGERIEGVTREMAALARSIAERERKTEGGSSDGKDKDSTAKIVSDMASKLMTEQHFLSDKATRGAIYHYNPDLGIWENDGEAYIRNYVACNTSENYRSHIVNEVVRAIKEQTIDFKERLYNIRNPEMIVLENGRLNIDTEEFQDGFSHEDYQIVRVPVEWDPFADCPEFDKFLDEVMESEESKLAIYELIGYCLYKSWPFDILVIMIGSGGNGKSVLFDVICKFLGEDNVTSITLHALDPGNNRFASSDLFGKLANIAGEISDKRIKSTAHIKDLTGGGLIAAERKHMDRFHFRNFAKMIFSTNSPPPISDKSRAMWRRLYHYRFPNEFIEGENALPRPELVAKLTTPQELSGILNRALAGWQRLKKNCGVLSGSPTEEERELKYLILSDPIGYMVRRYLYKDAPIPPEGEFIIKRGIYEIYKRQCKVIQERENIKVRVYSESWFHQVLQQEASWVYATLATTYPNRSPKDDDVRKKQKKINVYRDLGIDFGVLAEEGISVADLDLVVPDEILTPAEQSTLFDYTPKKQSTTTNTDKLLKMFRERTGGLDPNKGVRFEDLSEREKGIIQKALDADLVVNRMPGNWYHLKKKVVKNDNG